MDVNFKNRKLGKLCNSAKELQKKFGQRMAQTIMNRLAVLRAARTLELVPKSRPERRHQLRGERSEQYAVDLVHPYRLVFKPNHDPLPRKHDGGIDTERVTAVKIIEIVDYH